MDGDVLGILVGIALFLAGMLFKDRVAKRQQIKEDVKTAAKREQEGATDAKQRYHEKVARADKEAQREIDSRPITGSAADILADRKRRHRELIRRRRRQRGD